jgi:hypothetical protein
LRKAALSAIVFAALVLTGCGSGGPLNFVFPRIEISVDKEGFPSVAGLSPLALGLFGMDPNQFKIDPATVSQLTDSNLQHLELLFRKDGLYWWANGKPLMPLVWDDQSFDNTKDLIMKFSVFDESAIGILNNVLLPAARSMEQNVVVRFPRKDGEAEIPVREMGGSVPTPGEAASPALIAGARLTFDDSGVPSIAGVSTKEIQDAFGADLSAATLPADTVQQLMKAGVQHITIRTTPEGIKLWANDKPLPTLRWSGDTLNSTAETIGNLKLIDPAIATVVKQFLPFANTLDVNLVLRFPTGGAAAIPEPK